MPSGERNGAGDKRVPTRLRINVYPDKCIGAGHCVACAPDVFTQNDDDGVVILIEENPPPERHEAVGEAARMCPTSAIEVHEEW